MAELQTAITATLRGALERADDKIVRIDVPKDWPVPKALETLAKTHPQMRTGILAPFRPSGFGKALSPEVSPEKITRWRNEKRRRFPIVVCGRADGASAAGLRDLATVIKRDSVIDTWASLEGGALAERVGKPELRSFVEALMAQCRARRVDAVLLDEYLTVTGAIPPNQLKRIAAEMWRLQLVPDEQLIDQGLSAKRLEQNLALVARLQADEEKDTTARLRKGMAQGGQVGASARAGLAFRESGNRNDLAPARLADLLALLDDRSQRTTQERPADLYDLLNLAAVDAAGVRACLATLEREWDIDNPDLSSVEVVAKVADVSTVFRLAVTPSVTEAATNGEDAPSHEFECCWSPTDEAGQVLVAETQQSDGTAYDGRSHWRSREAGALRMAFSASADPAAGTVVFALDRYLRRRWELRPYEPWLVAHAFELLVVHAAARTAVSAFLEAWKDLVKAALGLGEAESWMKYLQLCESAWGPTVEAPEWGILGPYHPYRIGPVLAIAEYITGSVESVAVRQPLGDAASWLMDRCVPAYPAIYVGERTLQLAHAEDEILYVAEPRDHLPRADEGQGLSRIMASLAGFAPQLKSGVVLTLINPPIGNAVGSEVSRIGKLFPNGSTFLVATTRSDANSLDDADGDVRYVGRFDSLESVSRAGLTSHVIVYFAPSPRGMVAPRQGWQPARGAFLAPHLQIGVNPLGPRGMTPTAEVKISPREGNAIVCGMHSLYHKQTGNAPRHFQYHPMLPEEDVAACQRLAARADWVVIAATGQMGLAAPGLVNTSLAFLGREGLGGYGLYVYATDGFFAVRRFVEKAVRETPIVVGGEEALVRRITALAKQSGAAMLRMGKDGVSEHYAALVALHVAQEGDESEAYCNVVLRVDDMSWTRIWLGEGRRCDFLIVRLRKGTGVSPAVIIRAVESKGFGGAEPVRPGANVVPFKEALEQVDVTLEALKKTIAPAGQPSLDEDVRFGALVEHLMAAVLASDPKFDDLDGLRRVVDTVNAFSSRQLSAAEIKFEGAVVVTQTGTLADRSHCDVVSKGGYAVRLFDATAKDATAVFEELPDDIVKGAEPTPAVVGSGALSTGGDYAPTEGAWALAAEASVPLKEVAGRIRGEAGSAKGVAGPGESGETGGVADWPGESGEDLKWGVEKGLDLIAVCRRHSIPVVTESEPRIVVGPSLVSVSVKLQVGAQISLIEKRLDDLMRDIGLGERSREVSVTNDAEASTVRFLIPRPHRAIPPLPGRAPVTVDAGGYLPTLIGQTLEGRDFASSVEAWPHMLVAGTTGSGKTTFLRSLLAQWGRLGPKVVRLVVVDGKGDTDYLSSLAREMFVPAFPEPLLGHERALGVLEWALEEMERRRELLHLRARQTETSVPLKWPDMFRADVANGIEPSVTPVIILIDEFADLMLANKHQADAFLAAIQRVAQVGRSRLMHLLLATQRPDRETIRGAIKSNLDARVALRLPTAADSMTVLGKGGAERLLKHGDMLFEQGGVTTRLQGFSV